MRTFEFVRGRHLEGEGDVNGAIDAYRRAAQIDPASAEIEAELAGLYARQNRAEDAVAAAEAALKIDGDNAEAHWVLGTVYAALAQENSDAQPQSSDALDKAILHLEKAQPARRYDLGTSMALGRLYLRKNDTAKAIEQFRAVAIEEPGAAEVRFLLAQAYEGAGRRDEAVSELRQVVAAEPRFWRAWATLGELLDKQRNFVDAANAYGRAAEQNRGSVELRLRQATALLNGDQVAAARTLLEGVVKDAPTDAGALYLQSEAERLAKNYDQAEAAARRVIALEPNQARGAYALALVFDARREHRKVIETLEPVVTSMASQGGARNLSPLYVRLGLAYQEVGEFDHAVQQFQRAKDASGGEPMFDLYIAQAWLAAKDPARTLDVLAEARKARPDDSRFARLEADALAAQGQIDRALALLREQVAQHGDRPEVHLALSALAAKEKRFDEATTALEAGARRFPTDVLFAFQRAALLEQQRRYDEAEQAFREVLKVDPLHAPTLNYFGYMLAERGVRLDEAVSLTERALQTDPWNGSYLDSLGWAHFKRGDLDAAHKYLSMAVDRLPLNSVVQDHWGDVLWKQGDRRGALDAWRSALAGDRESIDPDAISRKIDDARRQNP